MAHEASVADDPEAIDVMGPKIRVLAAFGSGDDDTCLIDGEMAGGVVIPLHSHRDVEFVYVLDGALELYREGAGGWVRLERFGSAMIEPDVRHALRTPATTPARVLLTTTVRMSNFFREIGRPAAGVAPGPPPPEAVQRLLAAAERYGYWQGGPEENARAGIALPG